MLRSSLWEHREHRIRDPQFLHFKSSFSLARLPSKYVTTTCMQAKQIGIHSLRLPSEILKIFHLTFKMATRYRLKGCIEGDVMLKLSMLSTCLYMARCTCFCREFFRISSIPIQWGVTNLESAFSFPFMYWWWQKISDWHRASVFSTDISFQHFWKDI